MLDYTTEQVSHFWSKVNKTDTCWLWTGGKFSTGYGLFSLGGKNKLAHRFAYTLSKGAIPKGLNLDHLCRVRNCVNPDHLEPVTIKENVLRGIGISAMNARKTHCKYGHEFTLENTYMFWYGVKPTRCSRQCKACKREHRIKVAASRRGRGEGGKLTLSYTL